MCIKNKLNPFPFAKVVGTFTGCINFGSPKAYGSVIVAFVEDNASMSSLRYFENHVSYFVQNRRK